MAASDTLTYDAATPHRPTLDELGGATKQNHPTRPPNPVTMPRAEEFNQFAKQIEAFGRVMPLARVWVRFTAGAPIVDAVQALGNGVTAADFNVIDNAAGDTTLWWTTGAGGKLPATTGKGPVMSIVEEVNIDRMRAVYATVSGNPAVRVKTFLAAVGTDAGFVVEIY